MARAHGLHAQGQLQRHVSRTGGGTGYGCFRLRGNKSDTSSNVGKLPNGLPFTSGTGITTSGMPPFYAYKNLSTVVVHTLSSEMTFANTETSDVTGALVQDDATTLSPYDGAGSLHNPLLVPFAGAPVPMMISTPGSLILAPSRSRPRAAHSHCRRRPSGK
jgi:hypothetical protein